MSTITLPAINTAVAIQRPKYIQAKTELSKPTAKESDIINECIDQEWKVPENVENFDSLKPQKFVVQSGSLFLHSSQCTVYKFGAKKVYLQYLRTGKGKIFDTITDALVFAQNFKPSKY